MTDPLKIWIIIFFLGVGTYLIRFSFLGLVGNRQLPKWLIQHLNYVGVAVMPGLIIPFLVWPDATGGTLDAPRLLAAAVLVASPLRKTSWQPRSPSDQSAAGALLLALSPPQH